MEESPLNGQKGILRIDRKESKNTGGGPPPKQPSQSSEQIIDIFEDTPAFFWWRQMNELVSSMEISIVAK